MICDHIDDMKTVLVKATKIYFFSFSFSFLFSDFFPEYMVYENIIKTDQNFIFARFKKWYMTLLVP